MSLSRPASCSCPDRLARDWRLRGEEPREAGDTRPSLQLSPSPVRAPARAAARGPACAARPARLRACAISSRRRRTSSSWRAMWPSDSSRISRRRTGSSTPPCHSRRSAARASSALDQLLQLLERDAEQVLQPQQLGEALDVGLGVGAVGAGLAAAGGGEQADLLVVADRPRRRPGQLRDLADPQLARRSWRRPSTPRPIASSIASAGRRRAPRRCDVARAQQRDAGADDRGRGQHPERRVHVVDEGVELGAGEAGGEAGEDLEEDRPAAPRR